MRNRIYAASRISPSAVSSLLSPCQAWRLLVILGDLLGHIQHLILQRPALLSPIGRFSEQLMSVFSVAGQISHPGGVLIQPT